MSHLHRYYARNAGTVWELEGRWMVANGTFRAPSAIQWIATSACDLTCRHCYSEAGPRHPDELTTDEAIAMVHAIADTGCEQLVIAGGEPLLRRDLEVVIQHVHRRGMRWALHTHGAWVSEWVDLFERIPPAMVAVSFDGPPNVHDRIRGREGAFQDAVDAMRILKDTGCETVVAGTTVSRLNADHLADLEPHVLASAADTWGLHLFAPEGRGAAHRSLLPTRAQLSRVAAFCQRRRRQISVELDNEWGSAGELDPLYRDDPFFCGAGRFTAVVAANGDIMPCTTTDPSEAEGNVRRDNLGVVWRTGFRRFRGERSDPACADGQDCWLQTRNGNSCREASFGIPVPTVDPVPDLPAPRQPSPPSRALRWAAIAALASQPALAAPEATEHAWCAEESIPVVDFPAWELQRTTSSWTQLKADYVLRQSHTGASFPAIISLLQADGPVDNDVLLQALDEAELANVWDAWLVAQVWQRINARDPVPVTTRLSRHSRIAYSLSMAAAEAGTVVFQPWRSKAHNPRTAPRTNSDFEPAFRRAWSGGDRSSWATEALLEVSLESGRATLCRGGLRTRAEPGTRLRLGRLDVIELSEHATLVDSAFGVLQTPRLVTPRHLAGAAGPGTRTAVRRALSDGSDEAVRTLSTKLALVSREIRLALTDDPEAKGAPALRLLLVLWDE